MQPRLLSHHVPRHVPKWVAPIVADFEIFGRDVVFMRDVTRILRAETDVQRAEDAIRTLVKLGWLRRLPTRASHATIRIRDRPMSPLPSPGAGRGTALPGVLPRPLAGGQLVGSPYLRGPRRGFLDNLASAASK